MAWRILLIDDEQDILEVLGMTLKDAGYTIFTATDGRAGLAVCAEKQPHIVVTDIRMPRMDGIEVLSDIKARYPDVEVIVATAFGEMALAVKALRLDASDFITKPIDADVLLVAVDRAKTRILNRKKRLDDQAHILHQDKMMSMGRLAASVVHEINNPLAGVLNYICLMRRMMENQPPTTGQLAKFKSYLATTETELKRCSRIVSGLLAFSRKSEVVHAPLEVHDLIERCMILCQHRLELSNIKLKIEYKNIPPSVKGDANQLQQCLINLIFNAADAMVDGGHLNLMIQSDEQSGLLEIIVSDDGYGISPKDLPHIFEPFFTTKSEGKGTGLGLATTFGIIEQHKGKIAVESRPGQGSTFTIQLPAE